MWIIIGVSAAILAYALIQERRIRRMHRASREFDSLLSAIPTSEHHHVRIIRRES